jgi:hypothetical protein
MAHWNRRAAATIERAKRVLAELWGDRISRIYAVTAFVGLWLTTTLTEPSFLVLFTASLLGLLHRARRRPVAGDDEDDWL